MFLKKNDSLGSLCHTIHFQAIMSSAVGFEIIMTSRRPLSVFQEVPLYEELHPHESVCVVHVESPGSHSEGDHLAHHVHAAPQR